jgi:predicted ATPase
MIGEISCSNKLIWQCAYCICTRGVMTQAPMQAAKDAAKEKACAFADHQQTCVCAYVRSAETQSGILATIVHIVYYKRTTILLESPHRPLFSAATEV